ncbi:MAG: hypothetical protein Q7V57_11100 [Actinomycetota bacterium]|nr:hypothetical protein [Actinomycetota bacterium]
MTGHEGTEAPAVWVSLQRSPEIYELRRASRLVACVWWIHPPAHLSVVMARILDSLNRPAVDCAPSPSPTWSCALLPCTEGTIPAAWGVLTVDALDRPAVEAAHVVWEILPLRLDEWHQRIVDALNVGRGMPAVTVAPDPPAGVVAA